MLIKTPSYQSRAAAVTALPARRQRGSAILGIIALMLMVSVLGVTLLTYLSNSSEGTLVTDGGNQAFFMAESGARYAIARLLQGGEAAATAMDGQRFVLTGGIAFDLAIEVQHPTGLTRYCIDSTGISNVGDPLERQALNGYVVDVPAATTGVAPVTFPYAALVTGNHTVALSGSSYIDSYDSSSTATRWTRRGQYNDATVSINLTRNAADLAWSTAIYGDLQVGAAADLHNLTGIVNRPGNILGDRGVVPSPAVGAAAVAAPTEAAEVAAPTSLRSMPTFNTYGSQTLNGGNYSVAGNLSTGSAALTLSSQTYVQTGGDLETTSGGSITINGNFAATIGDDLSVGYRGLTVRGSADLRVADNLTLSGGSSLDISGASDLDVGGDLQIIGGSDVVLGGDADIDVTDGFTLDNGASLHIAGKVVLRVGNGFTIAGGSALTFGPNGSLQVYVRSGTVDIDSVDISADATASRFMIICASAVSAVNISGDAAVYAAVYAPGATVAISGSAGLFGAVVANVLHLEGTAALHYDQALQGTTATPDLTILRRFWVASGS
jgi:hypothetical protein